MRRAAALLLSPLLACASPDLDRPDAAPDGGRPDAAPGDAGQTDGGDPLDPGPFEWPVPTGTVTVTPHSSWKDRLSVPDDPFIVAGGFGLDQIRWVKFSVILRDPRRVYFQGRDYPFHYEFATERLDPFRGLSRPDFDRISLHQGDQEVALGAVLFPPEPHLHEVGVQLVRQEAYHPEMVRRLVERVRASLDAPADTRTFYMPTFEQTASARQWAPWLEARGVPVSSTDRWVTRDACYSSGWALGRLVFLPAADIDRAYAEGRLRSTDILLTDGVPAEVPYVQGILSLVPATPSSHVAILARTYDAPFAYAADADDRAQAIALAGRDVLFSAQAGFEGCAVELLDVEGRLDPAARPQILALKERPPLAVRAKARRGAISASADGLTEADVVYFGGKATGYGLLRATIPANSPPALALSFDLWDDFLDQTLPGAGTLRAAIDARLARHSHPPDPRALADDLLAIRALIKEQARFSAAQAQVILQALSAFPPDRRLRFRSSTNVEDTESFTGAGLYDSETGCAADDQDADAAGPSACDPAQPEERGALRAIQRVYASFYADNAVRERLRLRVREAEVGMALLVHPSYPDADELANGVAVFTDFERSGDAEMVSQAGAVSVTNPDGTATPERVQAYVNALGVYPEIRQRSSLVQLGATVLDYPADYETFARLFERVSQRYRALHPSLTLFALDFEYKKVRDLGLVVKQVRRLPLPGSEATVPVYLLPHRVRLCTFQGEQGDAFANHRLKLRVELEPRGSWLQDQELDRGLYALGRVEYVDSATVALIQGPPATWPGAAHSRDGDHTSDMLRLGPDSGALESWFTRLVRPAVSPVQTLAAHSLGFGRRYAVPPEVIDWMGVATRAEDSVRLWRCPEDNEVGPLNLRFADDFTLRGVHIETAYWFPEAPRGPTAGYTAPLYRWDGTTLTGLIGEPIHLRGYWSQTYRPEHHNFGAQYIFDPWLEPGLPTRILDELRRLDIRFIYTDRRELWAQGLDGRLRRL